MRASRPPEPGSPGHLALLDQMQCAAADARAQAAEYVHAGTVLLDAEGPWAQALLASVAPHLGRPGRRAICAHIAHSAGPQPLFVVVPALLVCRLCVDVYDRRPADVPTACHRCGRRGDLRAVIAQREQVVARGLLCPTCLTLDLSHRRSAAPPGDPR